MLRALRWLAALPVALLLAGAAPAAHSSDRDALRRIVQQHCLPDWLQRHDPAPCLRVVIPRAGGESAGYALLADRKGGAHFLLIPLQRITGIEGAALLSPGAPNYFADAWEAAGGLVSRVVGHAVPRARIGLAINSRGARGQDQLHIHIECLGAALYRALQAQAPGIGTRWSTLHWHLWSYRARRLMGATLRDNPVQLLARGVPGAGADMGDYTLVLAGMQFASGPGFMLVAGRGVPSGELLLDGRCAIAR